MMKLKPNHRLDGAPQEKPKSASWKDVRRRVGGEHPQRIWSLLLPPSYFSERR